jgi:Domain of unknown function (DUF4124)
MTPHRLLPWCLTALITASAIAASGASEVYKTSDADGRVTYSDEIVPAAQTLRLYDSAGIVPAAPVKPDLEGFDRRRDLRLRREALEERLRAARALLESARSALRGGVDIPESNVAPDLGADPGAAGVVAAYATPGGGLTDQRPALSGQGGVAAPRGMVSAGGSMDAAGLSLGALGGLAAPGSGPTASGGVGVTGTSLTPTGGAGHRVGGPRSRAAARYSDKVEMLTRELVQREAEIDALSAAIANLR